MIIIVVALIILVHFIYLAIFPTWILDIQSVGDVEQDTYRPGDAVVYTLDFCSSGQYDIVVNRRLVNGLVYTLPSSTTTTPPENCYTSVIRSSTLPEGIPPGTYFLEIDIVIQVNSIREEIVSFETETFEVVD